MIEVIGMPSGDFEVETFDVSYEDFIKIEGREPKEYDKSFFYVGLFRNYSVPTCKAFDEYDRNKTLIKVKYDDYGVKDVEETDIPVKYRYDGYEDDEWFK